MNNKQILDRVQKLSIKEDGKIKKPFNIKSIFFIILSLTIAVILAVSIVFLLIYFL